MLGASCHPTKWAPPHLHPQDAEDDKEGAADEHDVANGLKGGDECLYHQLQARGPANDPAGRQGKTGHCEPAEGHPQLSPQSPGLLKGEVPTGNEETAARLPRMGVSSNLYLDQYTEGHLTPHPVPIGYTPPPRNDTERWQVSHPGTQRRSHCESNVSPCPRLFGSSPSNVVCLAQCSWESALPGQSDDPLGLRQFPYTVVATLVLHSTPIRCGRVLTSKGVRCVGAAGPGGPPGSWLPRRRPQIPRYR